MRESNDTSEDQCDDLNNINDEDEDNAAKMDLNIVVAICLIFIFIASSQMAVVIKVLMVNWKELNPVHLYQVDSMVTTKSEI